MVLPTSARMRVLLLCLLTPALSAAQQLRFTTLDIGQGDSAVLITPSGCVALFDGGPTGSGDTIKAYLHSQGATRVDLAFVSHFHADHMGGIDEVEEGTDGVPITAVYDHGGTYSSTAFTEYATQFQGRRFTAFQGQTFTLCSEVQLEVVAVDGNGVATSEENAMSVAVKVTYGAFDALVGGDLTGTGPDIESTLTASVQGLELYKVHHHGSKYSSNDTFLSAAEPIVSFISAGVGNTYGHPTPECLGRLAAHGSDVWQTEDVANGVELGHIELTTATGNTFTVSQGGNSTLYTSKGVTGDTQAPSVPGSLTASAPTASEVSLGWLASTDDVGVTGYRVYRRTGATGTFSLVGTAATPGFSDATAFPSTVYGYRVTALDAALNESAVSNTASVTTPAATNPAKVIINEILANEPGSDVGGEFVELVNVGGAAVDLTGWTLSDATGVRHTFASGTVLGVGRGLVVFGSYAAMPTGLGNAVAANTGGLNLNNTGDTVTVRDGQGTSRDSYKYASGLASVDGVSMNRSPDLGATAGFALHTSVTLLSASPGRRANGTAF
ncbi:lamin tail domain-containing protein [Myxococcaceae bacterium GXIMD 01537]